MTRKEEIAELRRSTGHSRYLKEPTPWDDDDSGVDFVERLVGEIESVERGQQSTVVGVRDPTISALLHTLEEDGDALVNLCNRLRANLGREPTDDVKKSDVIRLAIRVGLKEGAPEYNDQLLEAASEHSKQTY